MTGSLALTRRRPSAISNKNKTCPVDGEGRVAVFLKEVQLGSVQGCAFVLTGDQVRVEELHEGHREDVVGGREAGEEGLAPAGRKARSRPAMRSWPLVAQP